MSKHESGGDNICQTKLEVFSLFTPGFHHINKSVGLRQNKLTVGPNKVHNYMETLACKEISGGFCPASAHTVASNTYISKSKALQKTQFYCCLLKFETRAGQYNKTTVSPFFTLK
ncbi:hypothetical protein AMECASPLE_025521 [Ameca splendens]|uniref:Uncharacterized protein n=1 Tax=Ameca splendens TaxID=208324 RepID=A0ABV0Z2N7_9TELE